MTTIRLTPAQKRKLREATALLAGAAPAKMTQGEAVAELADFALRHRALWSEESKRPQSPLREDPFFDRRLVFPARKKADRSLDQLLYGRE